MRPAKNFNQSPCCGKVIPLDGERDYLIRRRLKLLGFVEVFGAVTGGRTGNDFCRVCFFNTGGGGGLKMGLATGFNGTGSLVSGLGVVGREFPTGAETSALGKADAGLASTSASEGIVETAAASGAPAGGAARVVL